MKGQVLFLVRATKKGSAEITFNARNKEGGGGGQWGPGFRGDTLIKRPGDGR